MGDDGGLDMSDTSWNGRLGMESTTSSAPKWSVWLTALPACCTRVTIMNARFTSRCVRTVIFLLLSRLAQTQRFDSKKLLWNVLTRCHIRWHESQSIGALQSVALNLPFRL